CDPDAARESEDRALAGRGVWFDRAPQTPAVTYLSATLDTVDARALHQTITSLSITLGRLGDDSPRDVRRAKALGMLADPQAALDIDLEAKPASTATVYVHVDPTSPGATVEQVGSM